MAVNKKKKLDDIAKYFNTALQSLQKQVKQPSMFELLAKSPSGPVNSMTNAEYDAQYDDLCEKRLHTIGRVHARILHGLVEEKQPCMAIVRCDYPHISATFYRITACDQAVIHPTSANQADGLRVIYRSPNKKRRRIKE